MEDKEVEKDKEVEDKEVAKVDVACMNFVV
jgi:hypothetical protein